MTNPGVRDLSQMDTFLHYLETFDRDMIRQVMICQYCGDSIPIRDIADEVILDRGGVLFQHWLGHKKAWIVAKKIGAL